MGADGQLCEPEWLATFADSDQHLERFAKRTRKVPLDLGSMLLLTLVLRPQRLAHPQPAIRIRLRRRLNRDRHAALSHFALRTVDSALRTPHCALRTPHCGLRTPHSALGTAHSGLRTPHFRYSLLNATTGSTVVARRA